MVRKPDLDPSICEYYRLPRIRRRIRDYCGLTGKPDSGAVYLAALTPESGPFFLWENADYHPIDVLDQLLDRGADLARSLWDRSDMIVHLDVDYFNLDVPGEAFSHPVETFFKLEPTYVAIRNILHELGLSHLDLMTGQGYHFTGRLPLEHAVVDRLASLNPETPAWLQSVPRRHPGPVEATLAERVARAYSGLGMLMEHLAHRIVRRAAPSSRLPVILNGTVVGPGVAGRECVSLDLSSFGDPLDTRFVRVAFGAYQRHRWRPDMMGPEVTTRVPPLVAVPRSGRPLLTMMSRGRGTARAARLAEDHSTRLPVAVKGISRLLDDYLASPIARVHREFNADPPGPAAWPPQSDAAAAIEALTPCATACLREPNDRLLQPTHLQHLVRVLMSHGWRPRRIADLITACYQQDCGWGDRWVRKEPRMRADFDVRVFSTMILTGLDRAVDFNCTSTREKGLCPMAWCDHDLRVDRERLLESLAS